MHVVPECQELDIYFQKVFDLDKTQKIKSKGRGSESVTLVRGWSLLVCLMLCCQMLNQLTETENEGLVVLL